jgi:transposase
MLGMYLRETKRRNADGSVVRYFQLAENTWDAARGCAIAKVIYSFGRADQLDRETLRRLAASILRVCDDSAVGKLADDVTVRDAWPYGGVYVLEQLWRELGIDKVLARCAKKTGTTQPFERALFAMVANRAIEPYSKLYCWEQWLRDEVFLPSAHEIELQHLYRAMDFLEENKVEVERSVYFAMADLMNADVDLIFYDTTSLHFEVDEEDEDSEDDAAPPALRKRGYSKNGRGDAPQIVIGLAVTRDGLPVRSWVFPGNQSDVATVERVKSDLRGWRLGRCVFVGDSGMNSEQNRRTLSLGGGKYILAARMRAGDEVTHEVLTRPGRYHVVADNLRVKEVIVGDGEARRRYVVCHNPLEEKRQREHRARLLRELKAELTSLSTKTDQATTQRGRALLTSQRFGKYLRHANGRLYIDRAAVKQAGRYDGKWVVTSNDDTLHPDDLALGYKQLLRVEMCWRTLKSGLHMRPVFHRLAVRIQAHVSISVLALLLERIIEIRAGDTWRNVVAKLSTIKVVEYERAGARIRQTTALRPETATLLHALGVQPPPLLHAVTSTTPGPTIAIEPPGGSDPAKPGA